ncbi:hypothetical protein TCE0_042f15448 [Talaromyces pinophilus]|uniref:Uncharacterized protein n=1 Tax=Talaromyces pinophilus TaxID=128442 RepID=A0A6V8HJR0_TALPI|nr:hypothetical protein TCE0_042f15448 [Talaromyces pinophilus]
MTLGSILAKVLSLASFVIILIVVFAGTQSGCALDDVYMILLDVTKLRTNSTLTSEGKPYAVDLGAYDFYTTHVLNYCAGFYDRHGGRNTTVCTKTTLPFGLDMSSALLQDLGLNLSVGQQAIDWPYAVISDSIWISSTSKAVSVLFILNIIIMGIVILIDGLLCSPGKYYELYTLVT